MSQSVLSPTTVIAELQRLAAERAGRLQLLQSAAAKIREAGEPYTGVYMYMLNDDSLVLEAFDGRPTEHTVIPVGSGLCGRAVAENSNINVGDVGQSEDYIACSVETKSELIVLIRRDGQILGQIDVDSDTVNGFNEVEEAAVQKVADCLASII